MGVPAPGPVERPQSAPGQARKFRRATVASSGTVSRRGSASSAGSSGSRGSRGSSAGARRLQPQSQQRPATAQPRRSSSQAGAAWRPAGSASQTNRVQQAVHADLSSSVCVGSRRIIEEAERAGSPIESRVHRPTGGKPVAKTNAVTRSFLRSRMGRQCNAGHESPAERDINGDPVMSPWAWEEWEDEQMDVAAAAEKAVVALAAKQAEMDREQGLVEQDSSAEAIFAELDSRAGIAVRPLPARLQRKLDGVSRRQQQYLDIPSGHSRSLSPSVDSSWSMSSIGLPSQTAPQRAQFDVLHKRKPTEKIAADNRTLRKLKRFNRAPNMDQLRAQALASLVSGNSIGVSELNLVAQLFSGAKLKDGLNENKFVATMKAAFAAPESKLRVLFRKVDASADGYVDCDEFLQFLMDRESLRNTQKNTLGGGMMINNGPWLGSGSGMQTVCLRLNRRYRQRSSQQHGPSAPIAGQSNAYMAELCICLDGLGMYATADRYKGIVLWDADELCPVTRLRASAFTHPASGLEIGDPNVVAEAVAADEAEAERKDHENRKAFAEEQMSKFSTALAQASKTSISMDVEKGEADQRTAERSMTMKRGRQQAATAAEEEATMEFSSEQSITALVDRLAGDGDPKGAKEAWKTSCVLGLQHWKEEKVLLGNTLFVPFIAMLTLEPPYKRRAWGAIKLPKYPTAEPRCITRTRVSLTAEDDSGKNTSANSKEELFIVGDSKGYVSAFRVALGMAEGDVRQFTSSSMDDVIEPVVSGRWHTAPVTSIAVLTLRNGIQYVVTTGMDGKLCISSPLRWTPVMTGQVEQSAHMGLLSASYCPEWNLFATGGSDRAVRIWDDASLKQLEACKGHTAPVVQVLCNPADGQILSVASDKTIKVWDLFSYRCVQTVRDESNHFPSNRLTNAALDSERRCIVAVGSNLITWGQDTTPEKMMQESGLDNPPTHRASVVSLQWSAEFEQMVSIDEGGSVKVWEVPDITNDNKTLGGEKYSHLKGHGSYMNAHASPLRQALTFDTAATHTLNGQAEALPVTCACLDLRKRRLVTGAHDGSIWTWNINTGAALQCVGMQKMTTGSQRHNKKIVGRAEVSSLNYVSWNGNLSGSHEVLITTGWQGALTMWGNYEAESDSDDENDDEEQEEQPHCSLIGHTGDVVATAVCRTHLVSVCTQGKLLAWGIHKLSPGGIVKAHLPNCAPLRPEYKANIGEDIGASALCYLKAHRLLLVGCDDGNLYLLRMGAPKEWANLGSQQPFATVGDSIAAIACSDEGTVLVVTDAAGGLKVWDVDGSHFSESADQDHRRGSVPHLQLTLLAEHRLRRLARLSAAQRKSMQRTLRAIFDTVDTDGSGMIETDEFYQMCLRLDDSMSDFDIKQAWSGMDMDGDAKITFLEFCDWWEEEDRKKATVKGTCLCFMPSSSKFLSGGFCCGDEAGNVSHFTIEGRFHGVLQPNGKPIGFGK